MYKYVRVHAGMYRYVLGCTGIHIHVLVCSSIYCRQRPRGVAVDFGPKQSGWLINQLDNSSFYQYELV